MAPAWEGQWEDMYKVLGLKGGCEACAGIATADLVDRAYKTTKAIFLKSAADADAAGDKINGLIAALNLERVEWAYEVLSDHALRANYDTRFRDMVRDVAVIVELNRVEEDRRRARRLSLELDYDEGRRKWMERERERERDEAEKALRDELRAEDLGQLVAAAMKMDGGEEAEPVRPGTIKRPLSYAT